LNVKRWYRSKTVWVNVLGLAVLLLENRDLLHVDPELAAWLLAGANLALRFLTKTAVIGQPAPAPIDADFV
jgi:hypothetical protein